MLFYITFVVDHRNQQTQTKMVYAENYVKAKKLLEDQMNVDNKDVIGIEKSEETHKQFMERGLPFGAFPLGDHPYEDGRKLFRA